MKLCAFCTEHVLGAPGTWAFHHGNYASLCASAGDPQEQQQQQQQQTKCIICTSLRRDVDARPAALQHHAYWPLYRWTIRSLSRIRESGETMALTFRAVPHDAAVTAASTGPSGGQDGGVSQRATNGEQESQSEAGLERTLPDHTFYLFPEQGACGAAGAELRGSRWLQD